MKLLTILITFLALPSLFAGELIKPTTIEEFNKVSVTVENSRGNGGSGVIYRSSNSGSYVLTNRHVCNIGKRGMLFVKTDQQKYQVEKYKTSKIHDICVIKVAADLRYNTKLADKRTESGEKIVISGHPFLFPTMVVEGHMSDDMRIQILLEFTNCTMEEYKSNLFCVRFGGLPVISTLETQTVSVLIAGGNSGSPVFNADGEIVGLVFAGTGRGMSPGIIVPHEYIKGFFKQEIKKLKWTKGINTKILGRKSNSRKRTSAVYGTVITTPEQLKELNVFFPALFSHELQKNIKIYECLKQGDELCLSK